MTERQKIVSKIIKVFQVFPDLDVKYDAEYNTLYIEDNKIFFNEKDEIVKILNFKTGAITMATGKKEA